MEYLKILGGWWAFECVWSFVDLNRYVFMKLIYIRATVFGGLVGVRLGVAYSLNKPLLRTKIRNLNLKFEPCRSYSFRDHSVHTDRRALLDRLD